MMRWSAHPDRPANGALRRLTGVVGALALAGTLLVSGGLVSAEAAPAKVTKVSVPATGTKAPRETSLWVSWKWSRAMTRYTVQVSTSRGFARGVVTKNVKRAAKKPARGLQTLRVAGLTSGSVQYVRVRAQKGAAKSAWSKVATGRTRAFPLTVPSNFRTITRTGQAPTHGSAGVQWTWSPAAEKYEVQASASRAFTSGVISKVVRRPAIRPAGGVQTTRVAGLAPSTRHYLRIRAIRGTATTAWSALSTANTKTYWPDAVTAVTTEPGPGVGEVTMKWKASGVHTTGFKLVTSLTSKEVDTSGTRRYQRTTWFGPDEREHVFSEAEMASLGSPLGSANQLYGVLFAVNKGNLETHTKQGNVGWITLMARGKPASGEGEPITMASYNVLANGLKGLAWADREHKVVNNILDSGADVVAFQELSPGSISPQETQVGSLASALQNAGQSHNRDFRVVRTATYMPGTTPAAGIQANRIAYDANKYELVEPCSDAPAQPDCTIDYQSRFAAIAHLQQKGDPTVRFWVVSAHLLPTQIGSEAQSEVRRRNELEAIMAGMDDLNPGNEPILLGMDTNSSVRYEGNQPLVRDALMAGDYYDTAAAGNLTTAILNNVYKYSTVNGWQDATTFKNIEKFEDGLAARIDVIATKNLDGADAFGIDVHTTDPRPGSDHNLIWARLRLPAGTP